MAKKTTKNAEKEKEEQLEKPSEIDVESEDESYAFPSKSRCPRCGSMNTKRTGSHQGTQYRRCLNPVCRWTYSVKGKRI